MAGEILRVKFNWLKFNLRVNSVGGVRVILGERHLLATTSLRLFTVLQLDFIETASPSTFLTSQHHWGKVTPATPFSATHALGALFLRSKNGFHSSMSHTFIIQQARRKIRALHLISPAKKPFDHIAQLLCYHNKDHTYSTPPFNALMQGVVGSILSA